MKMNGSKKKAAIIMSLIALVIITGGAFWVWHTGSSRSKNIDSYKACVGAGYPVQLSYPTVCHGPEGKSFKNPEKSAAPPGNGIKGSWCPSNPQVKTPCIEGTSTSNHPSGYVFTPN
jgi:hypothetical protein